MDYFWWVFLAIAAFLGIVLLAAYIFSAYCVQRLAKNMGHKKYSWFAWIPLVNSVLVCWMAGVSGVFSGLYKDKIIVARSTLKY